MKTILLLLLCCPAAVVLLSVALSRHASAAPGKAVSAPLAEAMSSHGIDSAQAGSDGDAVSLHAVAYTVGGANGAGPANP
jgi:hypothetical protein